ncbi:MAG: branched-chain amino acid aminotransferase [Polyangiales bacterium]
MTEEILVQRTKTSRPRPAEDALGFGRHFADHMFVLDWEEARGWHSPRVVPYAPFTLDPAAAVLHYGQALFEGLKAMRAVDGAVRLFRPDRHCARMAHGAPRLCLPVPEPALLQRAITTLVGVDRDWVPSSEGTALYIRPTLIATEPFLGVRPAAKCMLFVITSPVGAYYGGSGLKPVKIWVETSMTRAAPGGLGSVKAGANYAASLYAAHRAKKDGYDQVLWLDGARHQNVEEVGTMNLFALLGDTLVTPALGDSVLGGITRESVMTLARERGMKVEERALPIAEVIEAHRTGALKEVFGSGTAAVVSPVGELTVGSEKMVVGDGGVGPVALSLYEELTGIQRGTREDRHGWMVKV